MFIPRAIPVHFFILNGGNSEVKSLIWNGFNACDTISGKQEMKKEAK
jgi:hypothetical protein